MCGPYIVDECLSFLLRHDYRHNIRVTLGMNWIVSEYLRVFLVGNLLLICRWRRTLLLTFLKLHHLWLEYKIWSFQRIRHRQFALNSKFIQLFLRFDFLRYLIHWFWLNQTVILHNSLSIVDIFHLEFNFLKRMQCLLRQFLIFQHLCCRFYF